MSILLVPIILGIYGLSYIPGRLILSRLNLPTPLKFTLSFGVSFFLLYLVAMMGLITKQTNPLLLWFLVILISAVSAGPKIVSLTKTHNLKTYQEEFTYLLLFLAAFVFVIAVQGTIPYYGGGFWYFDWFEHFDRTQFFAGLTPFDHHFGPLLFPARPALFNGAAYVLSSLFGNYFWAFQLVSTLFNLTILLPGYLLISSFIRTKKPFLLFAFSLCILLASPALITQLTYTWTKGLSASYVLLALYLYLLGKKENSRTYFYLAALELGWSYLTHYSTGPFIFCIVLDFLIWSLKTPKIRLKTFFINMLITLGVLVTWFGWALPTYGVYKTFLGNTSYEWQKMMTMGQKAAIGVQNLTYTLLPIVPKVSIDHVLQQPSRVAGMYDVLFILYSHTLPGSITFTLSTTLLMSWLYFIFKNKKNLIKIARDHFLWIALVVLTPVFGGIFFPEVNVGYAHVMLVPLTLILLCFAVKTIHQLCRPLQIVVGVLLCIDSFFMMGLRLFIFSILLNPAHPSYKRILSVDYMANLNLKTGNHLTFLYDGFTPLIPLFFIIILLGYGVFILIYANLICPPSRKANGL